MVVPGSRSMWYQRRSPSIQDAAYENYRVILNRHDKDDDSSSSNCDGDDDQCSSTSTGSTDTSSPTSTIPTPTTSATSTTPTTSTTSITSTTSDSTSLTTSTAEAISTVWVTSSSISTVTVAATGGTALSDSLPSPTGNVIVIGEQNGDSNNSGKKSHEKHHGSLTNNNKFAIIFGTIGAVGFLVGIIWAIVLIRRRRRRRQQRDDQSSLKDYTTNFGNPADPSSKLSSIPFLIPFARLQAASSPDGSSDGRTGSMSFKFHKSKVSNASIMDEAIRDAVPQGFLNEKKHDPNYPLPLLEPAPVAQASLRKSIAGWFRGSSGNHPLRLNPMSRWGRSTKGQSTFSGDAAERGMGATDSSVYSVQSPASQDMTTTTSNKISRMTQLDLPQLDEQPRRISPEPLELAPQPLEVEAVELPVPEPVVYNNQDEMQAYYKTVLNGMQQQQNTERMSTASTWTAGTRSTMQGLHASMVPSTPGLSPPAYYLTNSNRQTATDLDFSARYTWRSTTSGVGVGSELKHEVEEEQHELPSSTTNLAAAGQRDSTATAHIGAKLERLETMGDGRK